LREREWDRPGGDHLRVPPALGQAELYSSEPISPELVLFSPPELGRRAREQLPNPLADTAASSPRPTRRADDFGWRKLSAAAEDTTDLHEPSRQSHFSWRRVIAAVVVLVALAGAAIVVLPRPWVTLSSSERRSETAATEDIPQTRALGDAARRGPLAPHAAKKLHPQTATARAAIGHATTLHRQRATVAAAATRRPLAPSRARPATTAAMVGKGPFLTWSVRPGGSRYWVDLTIVRSHGEQVLLTFMTEEPRLRVPTSWYNAGRRRKLVRAHYRWYVWRSERATRIGSSAAPLASGEFTIR
jgi:hypothetical protein